MRRMGMAPVALAAAAVAALVGPGQLWVARAVKVLEPAQDYTAGNDTWPFQQYLLAWYTASSVALAVAVVWPTAGRQPRWNAQFGVMVGAVAGASAVFPIARAWSAGAEAVGDAVWGATRAVVVGLTVGAAGALLATASPAVRRGLIAWIGWTWAAAVTAGAARLSATPFGLPPTPPPDNHVRDWLAVLSPLVMFAVLGAWAAWRGDRLPVVGAIAGPLLLSAPSGVLAQFNGFGGDHYNPGTEFWLWLFLSLLGGCVAAGAAAIARARRRGAGPGSEPAAPTGGSMATTLLQVAGGLLTATALLEVGSQIVAATGVLAFFVGLLATRGVRLGPIAGATIASIAFLTLNVLTALLHGMPVEYALQPPLRLAVGLPIILAVGLLGRTPRAAAVSGLAVILASTAWIPATVSQYGIDSDDLDRLLPGLALMFLGAAALIATLAATRPGLQPTGRPAASEPSGH